MRRCQAIVAHWIPVSLALRLPQWCLRQWCFSHRGVPCLRRAPWEEVRNGTRLCDRHVEPICSVMVATVGLGRPVVWVGP